MPQVLPFAGVRYDVGKIGSLSNVVAPPYDVIDPELQDKLYKKDDANVVRVVLNRCEPGEAPDERYLRAAKIFDRWLASGVLVQDSQPAIYVYNQEFEFAAQTFCRRGFIGRVRLENFGEGNIYPHEETHPKAKADRLKLTEATQINCSPIFGLYPDPQNEIPLLLEEATLDKTPIQAIDHLGVEHSMWVMSDPGVLATVSQSLLEKPLFIADGHHRYETACLYRDSLREKQGPLDENHPANFVMTHLVSMSDPGMIVLPTHRLFRGTPRFTSADLIEKLSICFHCEIFGIGPDAAADCWDQMELADRQGLLALFASGDGKWVLCDAKPEVSRQMKSLAPTHSNDWCALGVSLLHRLVVGSLLQCEGHPKPTYVHRVNDVIGALNGEGRRSEDDSDEPYTLAALVMPASISDVEAISLNKERMPAKSTYFFPKLLSGMAFHSLR